MRLIHKAYAAAVVAVLACFAIADAQAQTATQVPPPPYPLPTVKPPAAPPIQYPFYLDGSFAAQWRQPASDPAGTTTFDPGFMASVAAGARFGLPWWCSECGAIRIEGEYNHFNNTNDTLLVTALPPPYNRPLPALGNIDVNTFFLNGAYDFNLSRFGFGWPVKPFVSAGIGGLQSEIHSLANAPSVALAQFIVNSTSEWIPVWQVKVGAALPITDRLDLFADYRYVRGGSHLNFVIDSRGDTARPEIAFNVVELGARLNF